MGLPGTTDPSVYRGLRDVLDRQPEITAVTYEPDSIIKAWLRATIAPDRVRPPTGPETPHAAAARALDNSEEVIREHYSHIEAGELADQRKLFRTSDR